MSPPKKTQSGRYHLGLLRKQEYGVGDNVLFSGVYECLETGEYKAFQKGEQFSVPDEGEIAADDVTWVATDNVITFITKNLNVEWHNVETVGQHIADLITAHAGRMGFVYFHAVWFGLWILANNGYFGPSFVFDPFPYGLLTMIVSLEAIFLATFIMISQNVQSQRSELRAELDYQTNLKAEKEIAEVLAILKELRDHDLAAEEEELEGRIDPRSSKKRLRERLAALRAKRLAENDLRDDQ